MNIIEYLAAFKMEEQVNQQLRYLRSCYKWAKDVLGDEFESTMCEICKQILDWQELYNLPFDDAGLLMAYPDKRIPDTDTDLHRCIQAALMWNKYDNEFSFK